MDICTEEVGNVLTNDNIKNFIKTLGFIPVNGLSDVYAKTYPQHNNYSIRIDVTAGRIEYIDTSFDEFSRIVVWDGTTSNFSHSENLVVLECVGRLLEKGYTPKCIELEKVYPSGRGHSGRLDVLVNSLDGQAFLMIECKTWGKEYEKEQKKMLADGGQLFTYYKHATAARHLCLYTSNINKSMIEYVNSIVDVQDEWSSLSETKDIYEHWNKTFKKNGIFEEYASPYNIVHKRLTYGDLENMREEDSGKIYNQIMEILRHNGISDKPNAFNKLLNLFVCKIIDEDKNEDDELEFQCWDGLTDEKLQMTLNDLYKEGMWRFLNIEVIDHSMDEVTEKLDGVSNAAHRTALMDIISDLRLKKSPNFAFVEVLDDKTFRLNAKIVREIVELLQGYKFRYEQKHEFLGNFFELLLNTSMKQEAGQFFTPVPITKFIISSLPLKDFVQKRVDSKSSDPLPTAIDYACGSGHFLTEYMSQLQDVIEAVEIGKASPSVKKLFSSWRDSVKFSWADEYVYGIDFDNRLVKTTKVSAFFNGDGEATIVWGNGLDNFEKSTEYRDKLKRTLSNKRDNGQFDILISNPPYSVQSFRRMLKHGKETFELFDGLTDNSSEIECLFVERTKQLLKVGGWVGIILPSSMLSNGGIYTRARDIIFKYFYVKAIVELGSGTFMKTGTNTVVLFLERRPDGEHENIMQAINSFFENKRDVTVLGIENAFSKYVANVYDDMSFDEYVSFANKYANESIKSHQLWKDYVKEHGEKPYEKAFEVEREKMLYFLLTYNQNIVLAKSGQKQDEKAFLGYEFSERRGYEGMKRLPKGTMLFDESGNVANTQKVNCYIYNAFLGNSALDIDGVIAKHVSYGRMSGYIEYGTGVFNKKVNLHKISKIESRYPQIALQEICDVKIGGTPSRNNPEYFTGEYLWVSVSELNGKEITDTKEKITANAIDNSNVKLIKRGTTLLSFKLSIGKTAIAGKDLYTNEAIAALIPLCQEQLLDKYLFYLFSSGLVDLKTLKGDNAFGKSLNSGLLKSLTIPLPSLDVQRQIVSECEAVENEIEIVIESIASARESINEKFMEMFVEVSEWRTTQLGNVCELKAGKFISASDINPDYSEGLYPCYGGNGLRGYVDRYSHDGDYPLIGRQGALSGNVQYVQGKFYATEHAVVTRPYHIDEIDTLWLSFLLKEKDLNQLATGAAQPGLTVGKLNQVSIILPPHNLQTYFANFMRQTESTILEYQHRLEELNKKRKDILEKHL
jgi:type I restriction enzyme M protein